MATTVGTLLVNVIGNAAGLATTLANAERTVNQFGSRMFNAGTRVAAGVSLPVAGFLKSITTLGAGFDAAMTNSLSIMQDVGADMRSTMEKTAIDISKTSKFSATEIAAGYYDLASAGFSAEESLKSIGTVATFAQAGLMKMDVAGEHLSGAVNALGLGLGGAEEKAAAMARVADVLTAANNNALGTVEDFSEALTTRFASGMKSANIELEDGVALLMAYAQQNIKGKAASQQAWMALRDVQSKVLTAKDAWAEYGINVYDANGAMYNMADILDQIQKRMQGFTKDQAKKFLITGEWDEKALGKKMTVKEGRQLMLDLKIPERSVTALQKILGESDSIRKNAEMLRNAQGTALEVSLKQAEAISAKWAMAWHKVEAAGLKAFEGLRPVILDTIAAVGDFAEILDGWADRFNALDESTRKWIVGLTIAVALLGPFMMLMGSLVITGQAALGFFAGFFRVVGSGIGPMIAWTQAVSGSWKEMDKGIPLLKRLKDLMGAALAPGLITGMQAFGGWLLTLGELAVRLAARFVKLHLLWEMLGPALEYITASGERFLNVFRPLKWVVEIFDQLMGSVSGASVDWDRWGKTAESAGRIVAGILETIAFGWLQIAMLLEGADYSYIFTAIGEGVLWAWDKVKGFFGYFWDKLVETFTEGPKLLWAFIKDIPILGDVLEAAWTLGTYMAGQFWAMVKTVSGIVWDFIKDIPILGDVMEAAWTVASYGVGQFVSFASTMLGIFWDTAITQAGVAAEEIAKAIYSAVTPDFVEDIHKSAREALGLADAATGHEKVDALADAFDRWRLSIGATHIELESLRDLYAAGWQGPVDVGEFQGPMPESMSDRVRRMLEGRKPPGAPDDEPGQPTATAAKRDPVDEAYKELMGDGGRKWRDTAKAVELHKNEILKDADAMDRLWEVYKDVRLTIEQTPTTAILEKAFETKIAVQGLENLRAEFGTLQDQLEGVTNPLEKNLNYLDQYVESMKQTVRPGDGMFSPEFFKANAKALDDLAMRYPYMTDNIKLMLDQYKNWGDAQYRVEQGARQLIMSQEALNKINEHHKNQLAELADKEVDLAMFRLNESGRALKGIDKDYNAQKLSYQKMNDEMIVALTHMTGAQFEEGLKQYLITVETNNKILEVTKRANLERLLASLEVNDQIGDSYVHLSEEAIRAIVKIKVAATDTAKIWGRLSGGFATLASVFDKDGDGVLSWLAKMNDLMGRGKVAGADLQISLTSIKEVFKAAKLDGGKFDWKAFTAGAVGAFTAVAQIVQILDEATNSASKLKNVMGGLMAGANIGGEIGSMFGLKGKIIGTAIGAGIGALVGLFRNSGAGEEMARIASEWGVNISEELADSINKEAKEKFGGNRQLAELMNFQKILDDIGGLTLGNFGQFSDKMHDFFVMVETGVLSSSEGMAEFSKNFGAMADFVDAQGADLATVFSRHMGTMFDMARRGTLSVRDVQNFLDQNFGRFAQSMEDSGHVVTRAFQDIIDSARELGIESKAIMDFLEKAATEFGTTWETIIKGAVNATGTELDRLGSMVLAAFEKGLENGVGWSTLMNSMGPAIDALIAKYEELGLTSNNAGLQQLIHMRQMYTANKELFDSVDALKSGLVVLSKMGALNSTTFASMGEQGMAMFRRIQGAVAAVGGSHEDALRPMVPWLAEMRRAASEYGFELDKGTQELIDQATELGLLKPEAKSATQVMLEGFDKVADAVERLGEMLEIAFRNMGMLNGEVARFPGVPTVPGTGGGTGSGGPAGGARPGVDGPGSTDGGYFAEGGIVRSRGMFVPRGADTVPAMLTPGELVLNAGQQDNVAGALARGGDVYIITMPIADMSGIDAATDAVLQKLPENIRDNRHKVKTAIINAARPKVPTGRKRR
jgi:TP901 family phage tail tape measure protein